MLAKLFSKLFKIIIFLSEEVIDMPKKWELEDEEEFEEDEDEGSEEDEDDEEAEDEEDERDFY